jgi:hypothetical protein
MHNQTQIPAASTSGEVGVATGVIESAPQPAPKRPLLRFWVALRRCLGAVCF